MTSTSIAAVFNRTGVLVAILCLLALALGAKGITSEAAVSLNGDMPRYLMNGVFFFDLLADMPGPSQFLDYTYQYFARYPALSLGHHPVLLPLVEAPIFALLGVSVASGRVAMLVFFLMTVVSWFLLVRMVYGNVTAFAASVILVSSPMVLDNTRVVMSDLPALGLTLLAALLFFRFVETDDTRWLIAFVVTFTSACYAKQLALFTLPALVAWLVVQRGIAAAISRHVLTALAAIGALLVPLFVATMLFSPTNVAFVLGAIEEGEPTRIEAMFMSFTYFTTALWEKYFVIPVAAFAIVGALAAVVRRERKATFFLAMVACVFGLVGLITLHDPRIAIYWVPPFAVLAAVAPRLLAAAGSTARKAAYAVLAVATMYQVGAGYALDLEYVDGYEEAASYVLENQRGATILYSSTIDTGYFVFYVRKGDAEREQVVLRANKVLATSFYESIVDERMSEAAEIYRFLDEFGTCHVVLEDIASSSSALELLRAELKTDNFVLRHEVPIRTSGTERHEHPDLKGVYLRVYEYKGCRPPNLDAIVHMDIPMMSSSITVTLGDLVR